MRFRLSHVLRMEETISAACSLYQQQRKVLCRGYLSARELNETCPSQSCPFPRSIQSQDHFLGTLLDSDFRSASTGDFLDTWHPSSDRVDRRNAYRFMRAGAHLGVSLHFGIKTTRARYTRTVLGLSQSPVFLFESGGSRRRRTLREPDSHVRRGVDNRCTIFSAHIR